MLAECDGLRNIGHGAEVKARRGAVEGDVGVGLAKVIKVYLYLSLVCKRPNCGKTDKYNTRKACKYIKSYSTNILLYSSDSAKASCSRSSPSSSVAGGAALP
jgi:hypothetical protein